MGGKYIIFASECNTENFGPFETSNEPHFSYCTTVTGMGIFQYVKNRNGREKRSRSYSLPGKASGFDDGDELAVLDEFHLAVLKGEKREVAAETDVLAGMDLRAALADDDRAGLQELAVVGLDAEVLRIGIATVTGRCGSSHFSFLLTRLP